MEGLSGAEVLGVGLLFGADSNSGRERGFESGENDLFGEKHMHTKLSPVALPGYSDERAREAWKQQRRGKVGSSDRNGGSLKRTDVDCRLKKEREGNQGTAEVPRVAVGINSNRSLVDATLRERAHDNLTEDRADRFGIAEGFGTIDFKDQSISQTERTAKEERADRFGGQNREGGEGNKSMGGSNENKL
ncbi:hypothetical protein LXL04_019166 [Taraxacum kok-saghyz]